ncbi:MAG: helix-turn-helix domain-containing protein [Candidatus Zixiibacteriota bacterium]
MTIYLTILFKYRIKKEKKILLENKDKRILAIAYDVGFQSKSTFHAAFTKFKACQVRGLGRHRMITSA